MSKQKIITPREYDKLMQAKYKKSGSLFGNTWTTIDGIKFQSLGEGEYYGRLKMKKRAGLIKDFKVGVLFRLVVNSVLICTYRADFVTENNDGTKTVLDFKSEGTEGVYSFKLKKKLMFALFGITVEIVKK